MTDLARYFKGRTPLDEREKVFFDMVDKLDKESFNLFCEITSLNDESTYKIDSLIMRSEELYNLFLVIEDCFEYLEKIEQESGIYAGNRLQAKRLLAGIMTANLFMFNFLIAIIVFVMINMKANKDYAEEFSKICDRVFKFDEDQMRIIKTTLENCQRLLKGKMNRLNVTLKEDYDGIIVKSNSVIGEYINGEIGEEYINKLPIEVKNNIVNILHQDLNVESTNIYELLGLTKKKYNDNIRLIKELTN